MRDEKLVELYMSRSEDAILETEYKYGTYCRSIAMNILKNFCDAEECVNDAYMKAWETIPPQKPKIFSSFIGRITRNLSLNMLKARHAEKRGGGALALALEELGECVSGTETPESEIERIIIGDIINSFLDNISPEARDIFVSRYWYLNNSREIAKMYGISEEKVRVTLHRTRKKLREALEKGGIF